MKRLLKWLAGTLVVLAVSAAALYWIFGFRVQLDGSGSPRLVRLRLPEAAQAALEAHRSTQQRTDTAPTTAPEHVSPPPAMAAPVVSAPRKPAVTAAATAVPAERAAATASSNYWTDFRGPRRDGHYRQQPIRTDWPASGLEPMWKQPVGGGYASFVVAEGRAFTIEQRRAQEVVAAYDIATGRELWTHGWDAEFREWMGGDGPRATPTWADGRLYALGALGELRCLDAAEGRLVWRVNILQDNQAQNLQWGMAASPLVVADEVVVLPGGGEGRSIVAYDRHTGARRWAALDDKAAYSSPMLITLGGRPQILAITARRVVALVPGSGELLWEFPWVTGNDIHASQPLLVADQRILLSSSYGRGAAVIEIAESSGRFSPALIWEQSRLKNRFSSSVIHEGYVYGLDENILTCLDAATGEVQWKAGRYGHGQFLLASGHLILLSEEGELALVRATPERHHELVRFPVLQGKTWNHPALDRGRLLVRNLAEMAAFDIGQR